MKRSRLSLFLVLLLINSLSACAVLTSSQVGEVKKFARASEEYSGVPGSLASSYGTLLRDNKLLSLCRYKYGTESNGGGVDTSRSNQAWEEIKSAYTLEHQFLDAGKRMDAALTVLKDYSQLLTQLVSNDMTDAMGKSAVDLGKAVDSATEAYNKQYRPTDPLIKVGGEVGQVVRAAGGVYIRHRQAEILKETVRRADPVMQGLMADVEDIAVNRFRPDFINYESNYLGPVFESVVNNNHQVDVPLAGAAYDDLSRARAGVILSDEVAAAARAYAKAHHALLEKTRSRMHLKEAIEEIDTLSEEVSAAKKAKDAVEK